MEKLVSLLYVLMRDEVVPGKIEGIMKGHVEVIARCTGPATYSNQFLEGYARDLAQRILS